MKDEGLPTCFFATDLHGQTDRYDTLTRVDHQGSSQLRCSLVEICSLVQRSQRFNPNRLILLHDYLVPTFTRARDSLGMDYPDIFLILGNDDPRCEEEGFVAAAAEWPLALRPPAEISLWRRFRFTASPTFRRRRSC